MVGGTANSYNIFYFISEKKKHGSQILSSLVAGYHQHCTKLFNCIFFQNNLNAHAFFSFLKKQHVPITFGKYKKLINHFKSGLKKSLLHYQIQISENFMG